MSLHKCPDCGDEVATNSTTAGAFEAPPVLYCYHHETEPHEAYEMEVVMNAEIDTELDTVHNND